LKWVKAVFDNWPFFVKSEPNSRKSVEFSYLFYAKSVFLSLLGYSGFGYDNDNM